VEEIPKIFKQTWQLPYPRPPTLWMPPYGDFTLHIGHNGHQLAYIHDITRHNLIGNSYQQHNYSKKSPFIFSYNALYIFINISVMG